MPVALRTLGCKVNRVESDDIAANLIGRGAFLAPEDEAAVIIVNTCTVTGEADAKARKAVRQALKAARGPIVVVTGCLAAIDRASLEALGERVVVESDKALVADRVASALGLAEAGPHAHAVRVGEGFRTRASLKIEDGCDNFCSYCIVPYARGVPRGVPLEQLVAETTSLVEAGVRELVLTGINIGRYRDGDAGLADAIRAVAATGIERLRLSSIEPPDLTDALIDALASTPAVCEHLHVPLQSGCDEVLAAMSRTYDTAGFADRVAAARTRIPGLAVTTDLIAGFPGETDEHHARTLAFVDEMGFSRLHVFRYSERPGTPAAAMEQLDPSVRASRAAELRALGDRLAMSFATAAIGGTAEVLVERVGDTWAEGTTRDYLHVRFPRSEAVIEGVLARVELTAVVDGRVVGCRPAVVEST